MSFEKGKSGNPRGRPKMTKEEKAQREQFKELLKSSTVEALESIIEIANSKAHKDKFNACKYIIDKAYGADKALLIEEEPEPITIKVVSKLFDEEEEDDF
jgi:predicted Zn-ribbon and HTH transcriptional regulator